MWLPETVGYVVFFGTKLSCQHSTSDTRPVPAARGAYFGGKLSA